MATLGGELDDTWTIPHPVEAVRAHVHDLEQHRGAVAEAERVDRVDEHTLRYVLQEQKHGPYSIRPTYTVVYKDEGGDLVWSTIEGNFNSSGRASFRAVPGGTEVRWKHAIQFELPIPGLVARGLRPVVQRLMQPGIRTYVDAVLAGVKG